MEHKITLRAVMFKSGEFWVGQCLEHDIAAHAKTLNDLPYQLERAIVGPVVIAIEHKMSPSKTFPRRPLGSSGCSRRASFPFGSAPTLGVFIEKAETFGAEVPHSPVVANRPSGPIRFAYLWIDSSRLTWCQIPPLGLVNLISSNAIPSVLSAMTCWAPSRSPY